MGAAKRIFFTVEPKVLKFISTTPKLRESQKISFYQKVNSKILNINTKGAMPLTSLSCVHATGNRGKFQYVENIFFYFGTNCGKQNNYIMQNKDFSEKYNFLS